MGTVSAADKPPSCRPSTSVNPANKAKKEDRRITLDKLEENLEVSHGSAYSIVEPLGFSKLLLLKTKQICCFVIGIVPIHFKISSE
ncbi:Hypothetical predicted protein [Octopus vulgaris]|uniref:Uncharacterized protein n=1 Tax=Octopus vulgaris TaxID=6645 RepID=A0AA36BC78_OCTVU|nr:Hypothetical predicted protein [Octopus vulgaris]